MKFLDEEHTVVVLDEDEKKTILDAVKEACDKAFDKGDDEDGFVSFECEFNDTVIISGCIEFNIEWRGSYRPATYWHPEEWPEPWDYTTGDISKLEYYDDKGFHTDKVYLDMDEYQKFNKISA